MSFFQKIKDGAAKAADKAQRTVETTKLSAQISRKRKDMKDNFTEIGSAVYQAYQTGNLSLAEPEIARLSQENAAIELAIADLHSKISQLNDERMCLCGHSTGGDAIYCPSCGRKLEIELPITPEAAVAMEAEFIDDDLDAGAPQEETPVYEGIEVARCIKCREELHPEEHICPHCGVIQAVPGNDQHT